MTVLVLTGCTSGLGARVLSRLVERLPAGSRIFAGYRSTTPPPALSSLPKDYVEWLPLDLSSLASVDHFAEQIRIQLGNNGAKIDCVLLNAATWNTSFRSTTVQDQEEAEVWAEEFVVNHLAQFRLVRKLLPLLSSSPSSDSTRRGRIVFTSSSLQNSLPAQMTSVDKALSILQDSNEQLSTARNRYASSKLLQSLSFYNLQWKLEKDHREVDIVGVSPGFVPTTGLSRDSPWWQQLLMKWVIYYLPFCSTEEQGTRKILECVDYLLPSNPFPSTLDTQLDTETSSSRLVFHPPSLSPLQSKSTSRIYAEVRDLLRNDRGGEAGTNDWNRLMKKILVDIEVQSDTR
ncbi:uncharacterized protein JCM6883_000689 [Sporobolomyces salmoneus]|uniref:uncharacterized protein n=1 Tax=Sporobolomyces salmoneus TaxID=183962 RepID=UPI00317B8F25